MKKRSFIILLAVTVFVAALAGTGSAANPVPPSNETSSLYVEISATSIGSLTAHTDLTYAQGNGDLNDNPPLESGEGVATIGYYEDTYATSGSIAYNQNIYVANILRNMKALPRKDVCDLVTQTVGLYIVLLHEEFPLLPCCG